MRGAAVQQGSGASKAEAGRLQDEDPMDPLLKVNKSLNKGVLVYLRSVAAVHIMCHDVMIVRKIR